MRTLVVFVTVAVAGMALLSETPAYAGVGKDPATAYAPGLAVAGEASLEPATVTPSVVVTPSC